MPAYDRLKKQINETNYLQGMTFMNGPVKCIKSAINFFTLAANHGCEKSQLKLAKKIIQMIWPRNLKWSF